jgi:hypothetical protein
LPGLRFPVMRCFIGGKRSTQIADEIPQVFGKMLVAHLIEVIAPLFIGLHDKTKDFFACQLRHVLWFFWCSSILSVNVGEIALTR